MGIRFLLLARKILFGWLFLSPVVSMAVEHYVVQAVAVAEYYDLDARLEPLNQSTVAAQTQGVIVALAVDVNDEVAAGTVIVQIDDAQQQAQLEQAKANLAQAQAQNTEVQLTFERQQRLYQQGSVSQGELDSSAARAHSAKAAVSAAQAALRQAQEQLSYTQVKAPYSGVVRERHVEVGEWVSPGQPLMTGMALQPLRAVAHWPQRVAQHYQQPGQLQILLPKQTLSPKRVTVFPFADAQLHSVQVRAELEEQADLRVGQWVKMRVTIAQRQALLVPKKALLQRAEFTAVYVLKQGQASLRQVRVGAEFEQGIEVLAGLQAGETIAGDALAQLTALAQKEKP